MRGVRRALRAQFGRRPGPSTAGQSGRARLASSGARTSAGHVGDAAAMGHGRCGQRLQICDLLACELPGARMCAHDARLPAARRAAESQEAAGPGAVPAAPAVAAPARTPEVAALVPAAGTAPVAATSCRTRCLLLSETVQQQMLPTFFETVPTTSEQDLWVATSTPLDRSILVPTPI